MIFDRLTSMKSCCGCMSLKLGCLIIGYFEILGNTYGTYRTLSGDDNWDDIILYLLAALFLITINVLLVWGVHKKSKKQLLPWLICKFTGYIGFTLFYAVKAYDAVSLIADVENAEFQNIIIIFCCAFALLLLLAWYTFFLVYSFYKTGTQKKIPDKSKEKKEKKKTNENKKKEQ